MLFKCELLHALPYRNPAFHCQVITTTGPRVDHQTPAQTRRSVDSAASAAGCPVLANLTVHERLAMDAQPCFCRQHRSSAGHLSRQGSSLVGSEEASRFIHFFHPASTILQPQNPGSQPDSLPSPLLPCQRGPLVSPSSSGTRWRAFTLLSFALPRWR